MRNKKRVIALFNSRILRVSLLPFYFYIITLVYVYFQPSGMLTRQDIIVASIFAFWLFVSGIFFAFQRMFYLILALTITILLGICGIVQGVSSGETQWSYVIAASVIVAYGVSMFEFGKQRLAAMR